MQMYHPWMVSSELTAYNLISMTFMWIYFMWKLYFNEWLTAVPREIMRAIMRGYHACVKL